MISPSSAATSAFRSHLFSFKQHTSPAEEPHSYMISLTSAATSTFRSHLCSFKQHTSPAEEPHSCMISLTFCSNLCIRSHLCNSAVTSAFFWQRTSHAARPHSCMKSFLCSNLCVLTATFPPRSNLSAVQQYLTPVQPLEHRGRSQIRTFLEHSKIRRSFPCLHS